MATRGQIIKQLSHVDDRYLDMLFTIVHQWSRGQEYLMPVSGRRAADILRQMAKDGGLEIENPEIWQREIRHDRPLPFR